MTAFETLLAALDPLHLGVRERLRPPASLEDVQRVQALLTGPTPDTWLDLYAQHDGEGDTWASGTFLGLKFLPLADVHAALLEMQGHLQYADPFEPDEPDPRVQQDYPSLGLLPIFDDTTGNYIGMDLQPGPAGVHGQAVVFGADYDGAKYVASSLEALFRWVTEQVQRGQVRIERPNSPVPPLFSLRESPQDPMGALIHRARLERPTE